MSLSPEHRMRIAATRLEMPLADYRAHVEAGEKWCSAHHDWHPITAFGTRSTSPDGRDNACREVVNQRSRAYQQWLREHNRAAYNVRQAEQKRHQRAMLRSARRSA